ncbi:MAG: hypothetical protein Q4G68_04925, partial [Planctomycetia bacterium]|nr:hypothetical protein [Planctomycetia bacterium]
EAAPAEYYTLDEVKEDLRRYLAVEKLQADLDTVYEQMSGYSRKLSNVRAGVAKREELQELNLAELAQTGGFDYMETTTNETDGKPLLLSFAEVRLLDILPDSVLSEVYQTTPMEFSAQKSPFVEEAIYLYWVTGVKAEAMPDYEEIRDVVLDSWKLREASAIAKSKADEFAAAVKASGKSLAEYAASCTPPLPVVTTEKFSWLEMPRSFRDANLTYGEVRETGVEVGKADKQNKTLVAVGDGFYQTVYGLKTSEVGVVMNQPEDRAFVVQTTEKDSDDVLLSQIKTAAPDQFTAQAVMQTQQTNNFHFYQNWIKELRQESGFNWIAYPQQERN